jgi:hypothetical protein
MTLPEMSVIDTHLPSNTKIRAYTTEQMLAWGKACAAAEREECAKVCEDASTPVAGEMLTDGQWASKILAGKIKARGNT